MTREQERLLLLIVSGQGEKTVQGEWPYQHCTECHRKSTGYSDSQSFDHSLNCWTLLVKKLQATMREGDEDGA